DLADITALLGDRDMFRDRPCGAKHTYCNGVPRKNPSRPQASVTNRRRQLHSRVTNSSRLRIARASATQAAASAGSTPGAAIEPANRAASLGFARHSAVTSA